MLAFLKSFFKHKETPEDYRARRDAEADRTTDLMVAGLAKTSAQHAKEMREAGFESFQNNRTEENGRHADQFLKAMERVNEEHKKEGRA